MKCPYCNNDETKVTDSRDSEDITRRRRECLACQKRFTTYERIESINISVIKKDGRKQEFDRNKLYEGIKVACQKRPIDDERINVIIDNVEAEARSSPDGEIKTAKIGNYISRRLKSLDKVAYVRFASVYKDFQDLESFNEELKKLQK